MSETPSSSEEIGGICIFLSESTRKICYYITFILGVILFGVGIFLLFSEDNNHSLVCLIVGTGCSFFCPLWVKSFSQCCSGLKTALKLISTLIYFICFCLCIVVQILSKDEDYGYRCAVGIVTSLVGIWYYLSYIPNGQKALVSCCEGCCACCTSSVSS